jgi:peroxiredoxin
MAQKMTQIDLEAKLAALRSAACDDMPTPELAIMTRTTARLRRSGILQRCLQVGESVPNFTFRDARNVERDLYGLLIERPVVVNFFRGFWCAFCKTELEAYAAAKAELKLLGCYYLAISPQNLPLENDLALSEQNDEDDDSGLFQVLFDKNNVIAKLFDLAYKLEPEEIALFEKWGLQLDVVNESANFELPLPATYLINQDRTIGYQFVDADFRTRCCPEDLIEEVRALMRT